MTPRSPSGPAECSGWTTAASSRKGGTSTRAFDTIRFAAAALRGHRLRTLLTTAGLAVGIAAVVTLTALGEGARRYVIREFTALGSNLLIVLPGRVETTGAMPFGGVVHDLTLEDVAAMQSLLPGLLRAAPISMGTESVRFGGHARSAPVLGTTAELMELRRLGVAAGRFLSPGDAGRGGMEVVLGVRVAQELFGSASPLGEVVRIGDWRFRVVGVLGAKGRSIGLDMDDLVIVPVQTGMTMLNRRSLFRVLIEVRSHAAMAETRRALLSLLAERHRAEDVTVISQDAVLSSFNAILRALTMALGGIASVSLAVAGIGIMNVMLVSVTERRVEIGLLKALGAGRSEILGVFLTEAVLLSTAGGLMGLAAGELAVRLFVSSFPSFPATPPFWAVAAASALSLVVGVSFGLWPARRAMGLDPIAALSGR
jgi:putative ABC transport system permease protein